MAYQRALHVDHNYLRPLSIIFAQLVSYSDVHSGVCACHKTAVLEGVSSSLCSASARMHAHLSGIDNLAVSYVYMTILCSVVIYMMASTTYVAMTLKCNLCTTS